MVLEVREVSRKTAADGRLEISEATARRLTSLDEHRDGSRGASPEPILLVALDRLRDVGTLVAMTCTCDKGGGASGHTHHFVQSPLFRALPAGETVVMELLDEKLFSVARPHPLRSV